MRGCGIQKILLDGGEDMGFNINKVNKILFSLYGEHG
jgi:hypothetical protein